MNTVVPVQQHPKESLHWLQRRTSYRGHRHALHPCCDQITLPPSAILEQTSPTCKLNHHKCMRCKGCEHILEATAPSIISRKAHYEGKNEFTLWNLLDFLFTNTTHYQFQQCVLVEDVVQWSSVEGMRVHHHRHRKGENFTRKPLS